MHRTSSGAAPSLACWKKVLKKVMQLHTSGITPMGRNANWNCFGPIQLRCRAGTGSRAGIQVYG